MVRDSNQSHGPANRPPGQGPRGPRPDRAMPEPVPLVLPEDRYRRPGLGRLVPWIVGGLLLAGAAVWPLGILDWPLDGQPGADASRSATGQSPAPERFAVLLDSLESSLTVLRTRHKDHEQGRIGCDDLVPAYRRVDDIVVSLAIARSETDSPDPETAASYDDLIAEAEAEERRFERSGCPRP